MLSKAHNVDCVRTCRFSAVIGASAIAALLALAPAQSATALAVTDVIVKTGDDLNLALSKAKDGAVIRLAAGKYGTVRLKNCALPGTVTITSAVPTSPAVFTRLIIADCRGLTFQQLRIEAGPDAASFPVEVSDSKRIVIDQLDFRGNADVLNAPNAANAALSVRGSRDITVSRSRFTGFWHGVALLDDTGLLITRNEFSNIRTDGVRGGGVSDSEISGNIFTDFHPAPGDHPDGIQLWSTDQTTIAHNITIRDNLVVRGLGEPTQGIFIRDTFGKLPFENVRISGNLVVGTRYNGITLIGSTSSQITSNEVVPTPDRKSWIRMEHGTKAVLRGNAAMDYVLNATSLVVNSDNRVTTPTTTNPAARISAWVAARADISATAGPVLKSLLQSAQ